MKKQLHNKEMYNLVVSECLGNDCYLRKLVIICFRNVLRMNNKVYIWKYLKVFFSKTILQLSRQIKLWEGVGSEVIRRKFLGKNKVQNLSLYFIVLHKMFQASTSLLSSKQLVNTVEEIDVDMLQTRKRSSSMARITSNQKKAKGNSTSRLKCLPFWLGF